MSLKLTDLISVEILQEIQDGFSDVTGMAALTTDADGNPVTQGSNFTDFCMKYTRQSARGCERCERCDKQGGEQTQRTGRAAAYVCHAGLMDFAAPIMINDEFIGSFIGGQVLTEAPNEKEFRRIAREIGVNEDEYIAALRKVKIVPKARVEAAAKFLHTIAKNISAIAYANYSANCRTDSLANEMSANAEIIRRVEAVAANSTKNFNILKDKFINLTNIAESCVNEINDTNDTIKVIKDIALNTRILGFNASIEASRAKESGKGFGVIAQEVRTLADTSNISANRIENKVKEINKYALQIDECAKEAHVCIEDSIKEIKELNDAVATLKV